MQPKEQTLTNRSQIKKLITEPKQARYGGPSSRADDIIWKAYVEGYDGFLETGSGKTCPNGPWLVYGVNRHGFCCAGSGETIVDAAICLIQYWQERDAKKQNLQ